MDRRRKARREIVALGLVLLTVLGGCKTTRPASRPVENPDAEALLGALKRSCIIHEQSPSVYVSQCPVEVFQEHGRGVLRLGRAFERAMADLEAGTAHAANDLALSEGRRVKAEQERDEEARKKWWFLGGGVVGGIVVTLTLCLLVGR